MSKNNLKLTTDSAVKEIRELTAELKVLENRLKNISGVNSNTYLQITKNMSDLQKKAAETNKVLNKLADERYQKDFKNLEIMDRVAKKKKANFDKQEAELNKLIAEEDKLLAKVKKNADDAADAKIAASNKATKKLRADNKKTIASNKKASKEREAQVNRVSAFNKRMSDQRASEEKATIASNKRFAAEQKKINAENNKQVSSYEKLNKKLNESRAKVRNLTIEQGKNSKETKRAVKEHKRLERQLKRTNKTTTKSSSGFRRLTVSVRNLVTAFGVLSAAQILIGIAQNVFRTILAFDSLNYTIKTLNKDLFELDRQIYSYYSLLINLVCLLRIQRIDGLSFLLLQNSRA